MKNPAKRGERVPIPPKQWGVDIPPNGREGNDPAERRVKNPAEGERVPIPPKQWGVDIPPRSGTAPADYAAKTAGGVWANSPASQKDGSYLDRTTPANGIPYRRHAAAASRCCTLDATRNMTGPLAQTYFYRAAAPSRADGQV